MKQKVSVVLNRNLSKEMMAHAKKAISTLEAHDVHVDSSETINGARDADLILVMGGDGTMLRGAELGRAVDVPVLGINYGHMGFLSEADPDDINNVVERIVAKNWTISERMTIDITVFRPDGSKDQQWALNEASVEKVFNSRMLETSIWVDGRELSSFKADCVLFSTPTGSTAYSFSAGGPIVWPEVQAMLLVPVSAHALFTRSLVVSSDSVLEVRILHEDAMMWCDGRRKVFAPAGSIIRAVKGERTIKLAGLNNMPFSERLVNKFHLPVKGWRDAK